MKLVYYRKDGCAPCVSKKPVVEEAAGALGVPLEYVDVADPANTIRAQQHQVRAVPTVVLEDAHGNRLAGLTGGMITPEALTRLVHFNR